MGALWNPNLTSHEATSTGGNILRWPLGLGYDNGEAILDGAWQHAGHCTCDNYESPTGHGWHTLEYTYGPGGVVDLTSEEIRNFVALEVQFRVSGDESSQTHSKNGNIFEALGGIDYWYDYWKDAPTNWFLLSLINVPMEDEVIR